MADIMQYLNQILVATYGEEVRSSIYNSIKSCYEDGKAGSLDLVAREKATAVEKILSDIVSKFNLTYNEATLWEGDAYGYGTEITFARNINDYDYLDFYFHKEGYTQAYTVKANNNTRVFRDVNLNDDADGGGAGNNAFITASEMKITINGTENGTTITIDNQVSYTLNGTSFASNVRVPQGMTEHQSKMVLKKIVGRKNMTNLDITSAYIGYDGQQYSSLGEAIRSQIMDVYDLMNAMYGKALSSVIVGYTSDSSVDPQTGEYLSGDDYLNYQLASWYIPNGAKKIRIHASQNDVITRNRNCFYTIDSSYNKTFISSFSRDTWVDVPEGANFIAAAFHENSSPNIVKYEYDETVSDVIEYKDEVTQARTSGPSGTVYSNLKERLDTMEGISGTSIENDTLVIGSNVITTSIGEPPLPGGE